MELNADGPYPDYSREVVDALYEMRAKDPKGGDQCTNAENFMFLVGWYGIPMVRELKALLARNAELEAQVGRLQADLIKYGSHLLRCKRGIHGAEGPLCDCGFYKACTQGGADGK